MPLSGDTSSSVSSYVESQLHTPMRVNISPARQQNKNSTISTSKAQSSSKSRTTTKLGSALDILAKFDKKYKPKPAALSNAPISTNNFADDRNLSKTVANTPNTSKISMQSMEEGILSTNDKFSFRDREILQVSDIKSRSVRSSLPSKSSSKLSLNEETDINYDSDFENFDSDESIISSSSTGDVNCARSVKNIAEYDNKSEYTIGQPLLTQGLDGREQNRQSEKSFGSKHETLTSLSEVLSSASKSTPRSLENIEFNNDILSDEDIISEGDHFQKIILSFDDLSLKRSKIMGNISKEQSLVRDLANKDVKSVSEHDCGSEKRNISTTTVGSLKDLQRISLVERVSPTLERKAVSERIVSKAQKSQYSEAIASHGDISSAESEIDEEIESLDEDNGRESKSDYHAIDKQTDVPLKHTLVSKLSESNAEVKVKNTVTVAEKHKSASEDSLPVPTIMHLDDSSSRYTDNEERTSIHRPSISKILDLKGDSHRFTEYEYAKSIRRPSISNVGDLEDDSDVNEKLKPVRKENATRSVVPDVEDAESHRSSESRRKRRHRRRVIITKTDREDCERRENTGRGIQQPEFSVLKLNWDIRADDEGFLKDSSEILQTSPEIVEALPMHQPLESAFNKLLLRQVRLTSRFMASQYEMYLRCSEAVQSVARHYQPTTLETTKQFIKTHRQSRGRSKVAVP